MSMIPPLQGGAAAPLPNRSGPPLGEGFTDAIESVASSLQEADRVTQQVTTGELEDLSQLTAATSKAQIAVELTVAFRDRAVSSFQQIMQMQV